MFLDKREHYVLPLFLWNMVLDKHAGRGGRKLLMHIRYRGVCGITPNARGVWDEVSIVYPAARKSLKPLIEASAETASSVLGILTRLRL